MKIFDRLIAVVLALSLGTGAVIALSEAILLQLDRPAWLINRSAWDDFVMELGYDDTVVLWIAIGLIAVGSSMFFLQLTPRRVAYYRLDSDAPHVIDRSTVIALLDQSALDAGALYVSTDLKRRRARLRAVVASNADHAAIATDIRARCARVTDNISKRRPHLSVKTVADS